MNADPPRNHLVHERQSGNTTAAASAPLLLPRKRSCLHRITPTIACAGKAETIRAMPPLGTFASDGTPKECVTTFTRRSAISGLKTTCRFESMSHSSTEHHSRRRLEIYSLPCRPIRRRAPRSTSIRLAADQTMKIRILGAGPAGLYFAALMKRLDPSHDIAIFDRSPRDATWGFGVVFSDRALDFLRADDEALYQ